MAVRRLPSRPRSAPHAPDLRAPRRVRQDKLLLYRDWAPHGAGLAIMLGLGKRGAGWFYVVPRRRAERPASHSQSQRRPAVNLRGNTTADRPNIGSYSCLLRFCNRASAPFARSGFIRAQVCLQFGAKDSRHTGFRATLGDFLCESVLLPTRERLADLDAFPLGDFACLDAATDFEPDLGLADFNVARSADDEAVVQAAPGKNAAWPTPPRQPPRRAAGQPVIWSS